ncbi:MAG: cytochrome P450 [Cellvibrionaceae bacterium]|jgi:cytochrome P450
MASKVLTQTITLQEARELQTDTLSFIMKIGFWDIYFLNHPDYIQHVFLDNWKNYSGDTFQFNQFARVTGKGLLTAHGDFWQNHRRIVQPSFHKSKLDGMATNAVTALDRGSNFASRKSG